jgi:coenzyme F420-0:L-glutamate ligase/coenzyme F420-1:gamma-L-glutamate ligase
MIQLIPLRGLPVFQPNDNFVHVLRDHLPLLEDEDILIIAHTVISRIENCEVKLQNVKPSEMALKFSKKAKKDPRVIEVVLQQSKSIVRMSETLIISETYHGFICANAGVDQSNARPGYVLTLPKDPDKSANLIQKEIYDQIGKIIGIIISDTYGRVFRKGTTNFAIGIAGLSPLISYAGQKDLFGYELQTTEVAVADELAAAAGLLLGQSNEGVPVVIVRGVSGINDKVKITLEKGQNTVKMLPRKRSESLFW